MDSGAAGNGQEERVRGRTVGLARLLVLKVMRLLLGGEQGSAAGEDVLDRRRVNHINLMSGSAFLVGQGFAIAFVLVDASLWALTAYSACAGALYLLPAVLLRSGHRDAAAHLLFWVMSLTLLVVSLLLVGKEGGLHWFLLIVAIAPVNIWPMRRLLLAAYFCANMVLLLVAEFLPRSDTLTHLAPSVLDGMRAVSIVLSAGIVTFLVAGQSWFAERHHRLLKSRMRSLAATNRRLAESLREVATLSGIIPICAYCKQVRTDEGYWQRVEAYVQAHSPARFSHGICPDCSRRYFPEPEASAPV